jgi:PhnB protein
MAVKPIPAGMHSLTPHIVVAGAAEAIEFYKKAFGAEEVSRAPDPSGKKVWHAELRFGDSAVFVNDAFPEMEASPAHASLWLYSADADAAFKRAVDAGAHVKMPPADMFWGDRMSVVRDRWGNQWTFAQRVKDLTPDEMGRASEEAAAAFAQGKK